MINFKIKIYYKNIFLNIYQLKNKIKYFYFLFFKKLMNTINEKYINIMKNKFNEIIILN